MQICNLQFCSASLPRFSRSPPIPPPPNRSILALPYQAEKSSPVTYDVDLSIVVTPPYHTHVLKVWLPVPPSDAAQEVTAPEYSTFPTDVQPQIATEPVFGNRFAYFEFKDPQGAQIIRHQFSREDVGAALEPGAAQGPAGERVAGRVRAVSPRRIAGRASR